MLEGWVAPASIVVWKSKIGRAKVCGGYGDRSSFDAPSGVCFVITYDFVALATGSSVIK